jgi:TonB family protein
MRYLLAIAAILWTQLSGASPQEQTGDKVSGTKYYLKILPADTSNIDHMPILPPTDFTAVDVQPVPLTQVEATYPPLAREKKLEGTVWIKCFIRTTGRVGNIEVMKSDAGILDSAAINAASRWTFKPAEVNGKPVEAWAAIPFRFKLTK